MGTLVTGLILSVAVALAVRKLVRDRRKGKSAGCCGDCGRCGGCMH